MALVANRWRSTGYWMFAFVAGQGINIKEIREMTAYFVVVIVVGTETKWSLGLAVTECHAITVRDSIIDADAYYTYDADTIGSSKLNVLLQFESRHSLINLLTFKKQWARRIWNALSCVSIWRVLKRNYSSLGASRDVYTYCS